MKKDKKSLTYVFVPKKLNLKEQKALAKVVSNLAKKVKARAKKVRSDFYHDMAVATRFKRQKGGYCR